MKQLLMLSKPLLTITLCLFSLPILGGKNHHHGDEDMRRDDRALPVMARACTHAAARARHTPPPCVGRLHRDIVERLEHGRRLSMPLTEGLTVTANRITVQRNEAGHSWFGKLQDRTGDMIVTIDGGLFLATVYTGGKVYRVRQIGSREVRVETVEPQVFRESDPPHLFRKQFTPPNLEEPPLVEAYDPREFGYVGVNIGPDQDIRRIPPWTAQVDATPPAREDGYDIVLDDGSVIDVLPIITNNAVDWVVAQTASGSYLPHGPSAARAYVQHAFDQLNLALNESQIPTWFNMLPPKFVEYQGSPDTKAELDRLHGKSDGALDELHAWRNQALADLVVVIGAPDDYPDVHGAAEAKLIGVNDPDSFVAIFEIDMQGQVFAHEMGHMLALGHDWFVQDSDAEGVGFGPGQHAPDGHGYNGPVVSVNGQRVMYRTIMAYAEKCEAIFEHSSENGICEWLLRFSNPYLHYHIVEANAAFPLGIPLPYEEAANAANAVKSELSGVANYRHSACRNFPDFPFCPND
ncbi:MAG: hypothetical protein H6965_05280 [Chromatiaceae bacterium]|nr:hypothetical protein [Chromatiaceae bacterium]